LEELSHCSNDGVFTIRSVALLLEHVEEGLILVVILSFVEDKISNEVRKRENEEFAIIDAEVSWLLSELRSTAIFSRSNAVEGFEKLRDQSEGEKSALEKNLLSTNRLWCGGDDTAEDGVGEQNAERRSGE
jgi:hypothetical protein